VSARGKKPLKWLLEHAGRAHGPPQRDVKSEPLPGEKPPQRAAYGRRGAAPLGAQEGGVGDARREGPGAGRPAATAAAGSRTQRPDQAALQRSGRAPGALGRPGREEGTGCATTRCAGIRRAEREEPLGATLLGVSSAGLARRARRREAGRRDPLLASASPARPGGLLEGASRRALLGLELRL
jgi:hypothetical protein